MLVCSSAPKETWISVCCHSGFDDLKTNFEVSECVIFIRLQGKVDPYTTQEKISSIMQNAHNRI